MMDHAGLPHPFRETSTTTTCLTCGHSLYHEAHFGGERARAASAYREHARSAERITDFVAEVRVGMRVGVGVIFLSAVYAGRTGYVTYVERRSPVSGFCTVQFEGTSAEPAPLPMNIGMQWLEILPLPVPKFGSQEEADRWLEEHDPIPQPAVPRFTTKEEADAWLVQRSVAKELPRACKICGDLADHDGKPHSHAHYDNDGGLYQYGRVSANTSFTITTRVTLT